PTAPDGPGRLPMPPATRRRVQQCFEHGSKSAAKGDFDYATDMFVSCLKEDPGNQIYIRQFLVNLAKKYNDNKKGSKLAGIKGATVKGSIFKAARSKDWKAVMASGLEMLKLNPWDISTLTALATACDGMDNHEAELVYLKWALDVNSKDAEVNRLCGRTLARLGQFDQAIACWHRVEQAKPGDEEAGRAVGDLAIEKTISHGGYDAAENSTDVMADKAAKADRRSEASLKLTPVQQLEKAIAKKPDDVSNYVELADLHTREERFPEAEKVLATALEVSGGEVSVREKLEDAQLRRARHQLKIAEKQAAEKKSPEAIELLKKMKAQLNSEEIDVYRTRSERYPNNFGLKFELGSRLKRAGQYNEAITLLQNATGDAKRKAATHMELGECFQYIKQYKLAMSSYETALSAISPRDVDERKLALYRAGKLAFGLAEKYLAAKDPQGQQEVERADRYLSELAGLEFGYKDVPQLLDKISKIRHKD
ncbi:MAG TPA: tetratricopeptide repeat protein, partial [Pirellulales bacterium]|nr:tetratricopeptide repeat protein [Pirellulales bacterium]